MRNALDKVSWQSGLALLNLQFLASCLSRLEWLQFANLFKESDAELSRLVREMAECMKKAEDLTKLSPAQQQRLDDHVREVAHKLAEALEVHCVKPKVVDKPSDKVRWSAPAPAPRTGRDDDADQAPPPAQIQQGPKAQPIHRRPVAVREQR